MPIELKPKTSTNEAAPEETQGLMLFNEDGELTLAGETVTEFLASADFSAVMESPDAAPFLTNPAHSATDRRRRRSCGSTRRRARRRW
jgi:hypothetical protein